jgi:hypothetical protein
MNGKWAPIWQAGRLPLGGVLIVLALVVGRRIPVWTVLVIVLLAVCPLLMLGMHGRR